MATPSASRRGRTRDEAIGTSRRSPEHIRRWVRHHPQHPGRGSPRPSQLDQTDRPPGAGRGTAHEDGDPCSLGHQSDRSSSGLPPLTTGGRRFEAIGREHQRMAPPSEIRVEHTSRAATRKDGIAHRDGRAIAVEPLDATRPSGAGRPGGSVPSGRADPEDGAARVVEQVAIAAWNEGQRHGGRAGRIHVRRPLRSILRRRSGRRRLRGRWAWPTAIHDDHLVMPAHQGLRAGAGARGPAGSSSARDDQGTPIASCVSPGVG